MRKERVLEAKEAIKRQRKTRNMKRWASPNDQNLNYYKCFQMNLMIIILNSLYNLFHMLPLFFQTCQIVFRGASEETCLKGGFSKIFFFGPNLPWVGSLDAGENSKKEMYWAKNLKPPEQGASRVPAGRTGLAETKLNLIRRIQVRQSYHNFYHLLSLFNSFQCFGAHFRKPSYRVNTIKTRSLISDVHLYILAAI